LTEPQLLEPLTDCAHDLLAGNVPSTNYITGPSLFCR
jgi:hypothetical protein